MATLEQLKAERDAINADIERASWQDYQIPSATWARYWAILAAIEETAASYRKEGN